MLVLLHDLILFCLKLLSFSHLLTRRRRLMSRMGSATLVLVFISSPAIYGQQEQTRPQPTDRIVLEEVQRDVSPPLRDIVPVRSIMASATRFEREMHEAELAEGVRPEFSLRPGPEASALTPTIGVPAALVGTTESPTCQ